MIRCADEVDRFLNVPSSNAVEWDGMEWNAVVLGTSVHAGLGYV